MKNKIFLYLLLGFIIVCMSSCSQKWYAKQCAKRFPITESVHDTFTQVVGKVDTFMQVVQFDCDSAIKYSHDTTILTHTFKVPCPPSIHRVDTFKSVKVIIQKDSAGNYITQSELSNLRQTKIENESKIEKQGHTIFRLYFILGLIIATLGIGLFLKLKKIT